MEIDISSLGRAVLFLGVPFVLMVFYLQWKWARDCQNYVRVLVAEQGGGGRFFMAPKSGGDVTIKNPQVNTTRTWPINELATIDVLYPGVGFVPAFMQKTIRLAIVNEGDWEPLLNRSPHMRKIASPDVIKTLERLRDAGDTQEGVKIVLNELLEGISSAPTREMIASPAVLGNLMHERVSEIVATISKDIFDPLKELIKKMGKQVNPTVVYIGMGLTLILVIFIVFKIVPVISGLGDSSADIMAIKKALGIP